VTTATGNGTVRWRQVLAELGGWIAEGPLRPGDRLPTESELADRFGVHRLTVRQALAELARAGTIRTVHGRGSFVAEAPDRLRVVADVPGVVTFLREQGRAVTQELVGHAVVRAEDLPGPPALPAGDLLRLDTVVSVGGEPWSRDSTWLPHPRFGGLPGVWTQHTSLTGVLLAAYGVRLRRSWRRYSAEPAGPHDAAVLEVPLGAPLLVLVAGTTDAAGEAVSQVARRTRGDRVEYLDDPAEDI
jgi:DNA-binding GntR family transcriptional regulator